MTGGRHRGEVPGVVSPPRWDEAAEYTAWQRWYAALAPAERTPRAIYDYMAGRAAALVKAGNEYTGLRVTEEQREAQWLRDKLRRAEREVERLLKAPTHPEGQREDGEGDGDA